MKTLGVTGGIGMGKSTAAAALQTWGAQVLDSDQLARDVVAPGTPGLHEVVVRFGTRVLTPGGALDRQALATIVFADPQARRDLEAIIHPRVRHLWQSALTQWKQQGARLAVVVIPLLFETGAEPHFDEVICLACTPRTQQQRLAGRGWKPGEIAARIAAQWPIERKMCLSHRVVWTEGALNVHHAQWARLFADWGLPVPC